MMNYVIILLTLFYFYNPTFAQKDQYELLKFKYDSLIKQKDYKDALKIAKQINSRGQSIKNDTSLTYALSFRDIGECFEFLKNSDSAIYYYNLSLNEFKNQINTENVEYATTLHYIGYMYQIIGNFKSAEARFKEAVEIRKKVLGEENLDYARSLNSLGFVYYELGEYKLAVHYFKQALEIRKKVLGIESTLYAKSISNVGFALYEQEDYKLAEDYFTQASVLIKNKLGIKHTDYAKSLNNLGILSFKLGDYKAAMNYYKQALEIFKTEFGEEHPDCGKSLNNIGILYSKLGEFKEAEYYYKEASNNFKKTFGEENSDYAKCLHNLGDVYFKIGEFNLAESFLKKALEIRKIVLGENHPEYAKNLNILGDLYFALCDYIEAEYFYKQSSIISKSTLGEMHSNFLSSETNYAFLLTKTNRENQSFQILNEIFQKKSKTIADNFEWLNDTQKESYWQKESPFYEKLSLFCNEVHEKVPESVGLNYNAVLATKSKLLEAKISSENYYREIDEIREELSYRIRLLSKLESEGSTDKDKMENLRRESDSLDKRLTLSWPEYAQQKKNLSINWNQVQKNLDKGEAAIEFVRFKNEDDSLVYYNALVLKWGDQYPKLVKLCKEIELQTISPKMGFSLYHSLIWKPMESILKDVKTIYYSPIGELYNVPFHAIYSPKAKGDESVEEITDKRGVIKENETTISEQNAEFLIDKFTLHQLTSTRYLAMGLKQKAQETIGNTIAIVGGINYDYLPGSTALPKKNKKDKNTKRSSGSASGKLNYLEGTNKEVEQINKQVTTTASWRTKLIQNNDAIEENIIKLEGKEANGILHLATHGYSFPEYDFKDSTISKNSLRYSYRYSTNPMVRSGLILAGGNWAWIGSDTLLKLGAEQNGILTALEVSKLNLKNTKLVVLSACETGLGKIEGSEGTFGLKRGFKLAGVEHIIVSLWSVPDKETMELMTFFYSDLTKTLNAVISFEKAQKEMRRKYPTEPEKWAGFVLVR